MKRYTNNENIVIHFFHNQYLFLVQTTVLSNRNFSEKRRVK